MINMTVIHLKTLRKYIIGVLIVIIVTVILILGKKNHKASDKQDNYIKTVKNDFLLMSINQNIPGIKKINHEENENEIISFSEANLQKKMLKQEFGIITTTRHKSENEIEESKENKNEKVQKEEKAKEGNNKEEKGKDKNNEKLEESKEKDNGELITTGVKTEIQPSKVKNTYNTEIRGVKIRNESKYNITEEMIPANEKYNFNDIIIFHTHTCESYTPSEKFNYTHNGNFRTTDKNFSVARVGDEFQKELEKYKFSIIHDTTYHDYPNYSGSYGRSLRTVDSILKNNANVDIVFDLHRDAISDMTYAPRVKIRR